tara:strand:- start:908 stop:3049 length:2142 start_codon:yes stop_codon:yes gene_type:complete
MNRRRAYRVGISAISLLIFFCGCLVYQNQKSGFREIGYAISLDALTKTFPFEDPQGSLESYIFVDIDEHSLERIGQWPWPRTIFARLLDNIAYAGPSVVGVDILLSERDRFSPDYLDGLSITENFVASNHFDNGDVLLAKAVTKAPVVLATALSPRNKNSDKLNAKFVVKDFSQFDVKSTSGISYPIDILGDAEGFGFVNVDPETSDRILRYLPLVVAKNNKLHPSFLLEMLRTYEEDTLINISKTKEIFPQSVVNTGFLSLPITPAANLVLHHGQSKRFRSISAADLLAAEDNKSDLINSLAGSVIVIGSSAAGLNDLHPTNLEKAVPGPIFHLAAMHQILSERLLRINPLIDKITFCIFAASLISIFVVSGFENILRSLALTTVISFVGIACCAYFFIFDGVLLNAAFLIIFISAGLAFSLMQSITVMFNKRALQSAFGQYLAPEMVKAIERSGKMPELGGEKKELSIVMTDMRNFTALGESYGRDVVGFTTTMNRYMTAISKPVFEHDGTLIKFIGDASMHVHGAPVDDQLHAKKSVLSALAMINAVEDFNSELAKEGKPPVGLGAGVNTGEMLVGNIGSKQKFGYDVLGDPVSVAARLEGQTKGYGVKLIVGPKTVDICNNEFDWWELDNIAVKGKDEPLKIYTVREQTQEHLEFLSYYYEGDWDEALNQLHRFTNAAQDMKVYYKNMAERLRSGKPQNWDGIHRATSK